jgi:hypothetical protein
MGKRLQTDVADLPTRRHSDAAWERKCEQLQAERDEAKAQLKEVLAGIDKLLADLAAFRRE